MVDWEVLRDPRNARLLGVALAAPLVALALALGPLSLAREELEADTRSQGQDLGALSRAQRARARSSPAAQHSLEGFFARLSDSERPVPSYETLSVSRVLAALADEVGVLHVEVSPRAAGGEDPATSPLRLESPDGTARMTLEPRRMTLRATSDFSALLGLLDALSDRGLPYQVDRVVLHKRGALVQAEIDLLYFGLAAPTRSGDSPSSAAREGAES